MDDRGFVFTSDLLLAMIIVTMAIGLTTSTFESLNYQMQDFSGRQSLERTVNNAADYLVKTPGNPTNWERSVVSTSLPGLTAIDRGLPDSHFLHNRKVDALRRNHVLLSNLVHTSNYNLTITTVDHRPLISIGHQVPPTAKEVAVANRTAIYMPGDVILQMDNLTHLNPGHPADPSTNIWYLNLGEDGKPRGTPPIYVSPGNVTTASVPDSSFYVYPTELDIYQFYIIMADNTEVTQAHFGFTDGDAVVNGTFGGLDDPKRRDAIRDELQRVHGGSGWENMVPYGNQPILVNAFLRNVLNKGGGPDMKMWLRVAGDPKKDFNVRLIKLHHNQQMRRIPVKLVLKIWE